MYSFWNFWLGNFNPELILKGDVTFFVSKLKIINTKLPRIILSKDFDRNLEEGTSCLAGASQVLSIPQALRLSFQPSSGKSIHTYQLSSVAQLCPTICDPMNRSTPGLPVHHQLSEFTQTHIHRVSDAIQPSHPLSSPSPPAPQSFSASGSFQMSQLFASSGQSNGVLASTSVLPMNTQD